MTVIPDNIFFYFIGDNEFLILHREDDGSYELETLDIYNYSLDENGFDIEQFNEIPSLIENEEDFIGAAKQMVEYVGSFLL